MDKIDKIRVYLEHEVAEESKRLLLRLINYINSNQKNIDRQIVVAFEAVYYNYKKNQEGREPVEYVQAVLSRSDALLHSPFYHWELFNKNLYMGGYLNGSIIQLDWLYQEFFDYHERIKTESKRYMGQVSRIDLDRILLIELENCCKLIKKLLFRALLSISQTEAYQELPEAAAFHISSYRGGFEVLYVKNDNVDKCREIENAILQNTAG